MYAYFLKDVKGKWTESSRCHFRRFCWKQMMISFKPLFSGSKVAFRSPDVFRSEGEIVRMRACSSVSSPGANVVLEMESSSRSISLHNVVRRGPGTLAIELELRIFVRIRIVTRSSRPRIRTSEAPLSLGKRARTVLSDILSSSERWFRREVAIAS